MMLICLIVGCTCKPMWQPQRWGWGEQPGERQGQTFARYKSSDIKKIILFDKTGIG